MLHKAAKEVLAKLAPELEYDNNPKAVLKTAAWLVIKMDRPGLLNKLITAAKEEGIDANLGIKFKHGRTLTMMAVISKKMYCLEMLLKKGVLINEKDLNGATALILAVTTAAGEGIEHCLLEFGADVDEKDSGGMTAVMHAAVNSVESMKRLIKAGADLEAKCTFGNTVKDFASRYKKKRGDYEIPSDLLKEEKLKHLVGVGIRWVARKGYTDRLRRMVGYKPVIQRGCLSEHPLVDALQNGHIECASLVLPLVSDLPWVFRRIRRAADFLNLVELCVKVVPSVFNRKDDEGVTPLMHTATYGVECLKVIVDAGITLDLDVLDSSGRGVLLYAKDAECKAMLVRLGAKPLGAEAKPTSGVSQVAMWVDPKDVAAEPDGGDQSAEGGRNSPERKKIRSGSVSQIS